MTRDKAQKLATRARMLKTGERYTAARRHVVKPKEELNADVLPQTDAALRRNTGKSWKEWLRILDAWGAKKRKHGDIASYLMREHGVPGWWAQTIAVGYERATGMRAKYQRLGTGFAVSVSKTMSIPVARAFTAFVDPPQRAKWLEKGTMKVRTSQRNRSIRFDYLDGSTRVNAYFEPKERSKTTVTVEHERLPNAGSVEEMRAVWKGRLSELARALQT
jgi:hypothetical protein